VKKEYEDAIYAYDLHDFSKVMTHRFNFAGKPDDYEALKEEFKLVDSD
jgi:hypothetical protein